VLAGDRERTARARRRAAARTPRPVAVERDVVGRTSASRARRT
jgi:hypothetical protein